MFKLLGMTKVDLTMGLYAMRKTRRTRGKTQPPVSLHQVSIGLRFQWTSSSPLTKKNKTKQKKPPQDLFTKKCWNFPFQLLHNLATHCLTRLWAEPQLAKIYYFSQKHKEQKKLSVSEEERARSRQTQQEGGIWSRAQEMCTYWSGRHQLKRVNSATLPYLDNLTTEFMEQLH